MINHDLLSPQIDETVRQEAENIGVRMATVTCPCGSKRALVKMYKCLYCKVWFCHDCAEIHFGKTIGEYEKAKKI